jgi:hypothetical protein
VFLGEEREVFEIFFSSSLVVSQNLTLYFFDNTLTCGRQSPSFLLSLFHPRFLSLANPVGQTREHAAMVAGGGAGGRHQVTNGTGISFEAGWGVDLAGEPIFIDRDRATGSAGISARAGWAPTAVGWERERRWVAARVSAEWTDSGPYPQREARRGARWRRRRAPERAPSLLAPGTLAACPTMAPISYPTSSASPVAQRSALPCWNYASCNCIQNYLELLNIWNSSLWKYTCIWHGIKYT